MIDTMIEVFKTDVQDIKQSAPLIQKLIEHIPDCHINFDLEDCDRILRVEGEQFCTDSIVKLLNNYGHQCEVLI
ncbi:hypothetical protein [Mucilaginibacter sp. SP1R1]|uniref:hypothetical protein n=1 Tax=Mucilaginibacter sp. SP1R1 TaxID=2723091 RepID=UPI0017A29124|nr:hypothetical protein [Mucilaginibacter sp. SP1R1]MBB6148184.1 hypothetical protein [Mucilaginibacter sp. SP1R1]